MKKTNILHAMLLLSACSIAVAQSGLTTPGTLPAGTLNNNSRAALGLQQQQQRSNLNVITTDRALLYPSPTDYHLTPGDLISVTIFGQEYPVTLRLDEAATARFPLVGEVSLKGKSIDDAQQLLAERLVEAGIYRHPIVTINLLESPNSNATVYGETNAVIPVLSRRRLIDVIIAAGGLPTTASHIVTINRPGVDKAIVLDMGNNPYTSPAANVPVLPGDSVFINRAGIVYMVGSFKAQGILPLSGDHKLTLMQATALSGGADAATAKYDGLRLIRTVNGQRTVVNLNIKDVLYGRVPDPILQADDIVFLPSSALKVAITSGGLGVLLSAVSIAISAMTIAR
ncbi:MAG: polysaccharide biosynthesis/export family protein [Acidobacteriaceae bacterium]|nr:polysaccharide biosynthesis/export family protein [Acidobacteriaceae bacterium]